MKKIVLFVSLVAMLFGAPSKFLMPEEAFVAKVSLEDDMTLKASVTIAKDIYLYADEIKLVTSNKEGVTIAKIVSPESVLHHDDKTYLESPTFLVTLQKDEGVSGTKSINFTFSYQRI